MIVGRRGANQVNCRYEIRGYRTENIMHIPMPREAEHYKYWTEI